MKFGTEEFAEVQINAFRSEASHVATCTWRVANPIFSAIQIATDIKLLLHFHLRSNQLA